MIKYVHYILLYFLLSACHTSINLSDYPEVIIKSDPEIHNDYQDINVSVIQSGYAKTPEFLLYRGGSFFKQKKANHVAFYIKHPKGDLLIDSGIGSETKQQMKDYFSLVNRMLFNFKQISTTKEKLLAHNYQIDSIKHIILTHMHFDHVSGIEDLNTSTIHCSKLEFEEANRLGSDPPPFIKQQIDDETLTWNLIEFDSSSYEIFDSHYDFYNDGSVILVPIPGHTQGSIGVFINVSSEKRYFFTGDLTWSLKGLTKPSEKNPIARKIVDAEKDIVKEMIVQVHHFMKLKPNIMVVPAHDYDVHKKMAQFPNFE